MALWEVEFLNGDLDEIEAKTLKAAKNAAAKANPGIGVKKAVLLHEEDLDDDPDAEDDSADESEKDGE